jgi:nitrate reductase assembly molybdenum cofactor insertion protein NarJ
MVAKEEEQKELHRTVEELPVSIQKSKEAISQTIDLMGEIGERLDASGQCYGDLVDLLKKLRKQIFF